MPEPAVETKPEAAEESTPVAPEGAKPEQPAAPSGGGETTAPAGAPSPDATDWKARAAELESKLSQISSKVPDLLKGMNEAQQRAAFYEKQMQALAGVQPPRQDPMDQWAAEAAELEAHYRFTEAAPIRQRIAVEAARRASREEFEKLHQQQTQQGFQGRVNEVLRTRYGIDPATAGDIVSRATSDPEAVAAALARASDPERFEQSVLKGVEERKRASERAQQLGPFGGGSGGRGIPGNGPAQKPRMSYVTLSALPEGRKAEIKALAREGKIDVFTVTGRGASERVDIIDPRDL